MSDDKNSGVDPRFDPAFQRGFDPSIPIEEYVPEPSPREIAEPVTPAEPPATPPSAVVLETGDESVAPVEADASSSRNPFLLFLGIISIALIAVGIWLFIRSGDAFNSDQVHSQGDYMSLTATIQTAPFIALLGAATAIGLLFIFAVRWRSRR